MDNGAGADTIKNDGIYSRYFAMYTGKGRYSVRCQVTGNENTNVNGGFTGSRVFPQSPDSHSPLCCGSDAMPEGSTSTPTGDFTRHAAGGAFQVINEVDPNVDNIPPGRVTDLRVTNLPDMIRIDFTAPGDDLDSNDAAKEYIIKFSSTAGNLTGSNFDQEENNVRITSGDLVSSNLTPAMGGTTKTIDVKLSVFQRGEKCVIALKALDATNNPSPVSNFAQIYLPSETTPITTTTTSKPWSPPISVRLTSVVAVSAYLASAIVTLLGLSAVIWYCKASGA